MQTPNVLPEWPYLSHPIPIVLSLFVTFQSFLVHSVHDPIESFPRTFVLPMVALQYESHELGNLVSSQSPSFCDLLLLSPY